MVGSQELQVAFSGLLITVGHSVALLDSCDLLFYSYCSDCGTCIAKIVTAIVGNFPKFYLLRGCCTLLLFLPLFTSLCAPVQIDRLDTALD